MWLFLLHVLKAVWRGRVAWFWPIWITITGAAVVGVAWVVGHAASPPVKIVRETPITGGQRCSWPRDAVALTLSALVLVAFIVASLKWEDFADYDDAYFTLFTLKGYNFAPPIWQATGRFFPLGHQEFNLIRHFTSSVSGYHALPIAEVLIIFGILLILDDELNIGLRAALAAFVLTLPSIVVCFTGLVFPDRNVVFWLACLVLSIKRFDETRSNVWGVAAAVSAQFMIYYKETAVLLLFGFALARLMLRCRTSNWAAWDYKRLRDTESRLDLCLVCLGILSLLYYAAVMFPHPTMQYADKMRVPLAQVISFYLKLDPLAWLFVAVVMRRAYLILRGRVAPSPLWDGLAFGGVVCLSAYLSLGLATVYYLAPVDFMAVLYVGRLAILSRERMRLWSRAAALVLAFAVLFQGVSLSAFRLFERKNYIHAKTEIANLIVARCRSRVGIGQRLFFPFTDTYPLTEFASYLSYRGVPLEGDMAGSAWPNGVALVSKAVAKEGPCVPYRSFVCHAGTKPKPGDLVIELPDDAESLAEMSPYRNGGELLFSYEPYPHIPQWLYPSFSRLRVAAIRSSERRELPDRWLHASVTMWK
jgi:hypothetical protein